MSGTYVLHGGPGTGAVAVEAALVLIGAPYELIDELPEPMRQAPVLVFPDGSLMSESAAILIRLTELHPAAELAPAPGDPRRGAFLRWMSFVSSAIYAHYWLKDDPGRLVPDRAQHAAVEAGLNARISECWGIMERQVEPGAYILGDRLTVLDLYVTVVSRFRPRRQRFHEVAPRLGEVVRRVDADPRLAALWAERYPFEPGWDVLPE